MKVEISELQDLIRAVGHVVQSNRPIPERQAIIECILATNVMASASAPPVTANLSAWYTLHMREYVMTLVNAVNEDWPLDVDKALSVIQSAYLGLYGQVNTDRQSVMARMLLGRLQSSLPPSHLKIYADWLTEMGYLNATSFVNEF